MGWFCSGLAGGKPSDMRTKQLSLGSNRCNDIGCSRTILLAFDFMGYSD
jgi:hypothetical protein